MLKTLSLTFVLCFSSVALAAGLPSPVVGGTTVPAGEWPDAVAVLAANAACTGTLIAPDVVLTAGHCIGVDPQVVIANSVDYAGTGGESIRVKTATAYPSWQTSYDVGVLVLDHAAKTKPRAVAAECTAEELVPGAKVRVVGFGLTTKTGTGDNTKLHQAELPVDDASCTQDASCEAKVAPDGEFTAGGDGTDACFGDSGGPVYLGTGDNASVIGVVSRGLALPGEPCGNGGVYIRADKVVSWIEKTTGRTIARASCPGGKADGDEEPASDSSGGCSAANGVVGFGVLAMVVGLILARPRKRRAP